jgi:hypothetical protein
MVIEGAGKGGPALCCHIPLGLGLAAEKHEDKHRNRKRIAGNSTTQSTHVAPFFLREIILSLTLII